jgi:renalase
VRRPGVAAGSDPVRGWPSRCWEDFNGAFVNGHPVLDFVADNGARRGDGAPVLVTHSTGPFAAPRLDDPPAALPDLLAAVVSILQLKREPAWARVTRWSLARPVEARPGPAYHLGADGLGLCGDGGVQPGSRPHSYPVAASGWSLLSG